jgi:hypothetical protein
LPVSTSYRQLSSSRFSASIPRAFHQGQAHSLLSPACLSTLSIAKHHCSQNIPERVAIHKALTIFLPPSTLIVLHHILEFLK